MDKRPTPHRLLVSSLAVIIVSTLGAVAGEAPSETAWSEGRMVKVGSHQLFCRVQGKGMPLVVLEPGITETFRTWEGITGELAKLSSVMVYDRAGYGQSDAGPRPRSAAQEVAELKRLLDQVAGHSRVVLVGHSLGGVNALVFATKYPDRVAGLAVLDPPPVDFVTGREFAPLRELASQFSRQFKELAATERKNGNDRQVAFFEAVASEHDELFEGSTAPAFDGIKSLGDIPLTVLSSERPNPQMGESAADFQRFWIRSNEQLSRLSGKGKFVLATNATHHIHVDAPQTVIRAVRELVEMERRQPKAEPDGATKRSRPVAH